MIDALLYAIRDTIRAANIGYGIAECEIVDDEGHPPPRMGNFFVSVHAGKERGTADNQLHGYFDFSVTLTARVTISLDRIGDQLIARNLSLVPNAQRQGFNAKVEQLRALIHMNWGMTVLQGQRPASANDNLLAWALGTGTNPIYGFCEPARYRGPDRISLVGPEWLSDEPDSDKNAIKAEMRFEGARRFQPQTAPVGPFV